MSGVRRASTRCVLALLLLSARTAHAVEPGFVVHFDCIANVAEARASVGIAADHGARVISVVPPAHIWENAAAVAMFDAIIDAAARRRLAIVITRIDAAYPANRRGVRDNYLYGRILTRPGRLPDGRSSNAYFLATAGRAGYGEWMEAETRYYAEHYGRLPNLIGFSLGPFVEPFSSERGGFLQYVTRTDRYELTQYTSEAAALWHAWLARRFGGVADVNLAYRTSFPSLEAVPMPASDEDARFGDGYAAYFDFVSTLNDWFVDRYERCRRIWHDASGRRDVPFILQLGGLEVEKILKGRPALAAFDLSGWIGRADAVGLSLYTNGGYPDNGHAAITATVRLLRLAREHGKDVFVLEAGCEAPNVVVDPDDLSFLAGVAASLAPRTWIYEFLRDKFDEQYASNPGKLIDRRGRLRPAAEKALHEAFAIVTAAPAAVEPALLRVWVDAPSLRSNPAAARLATALYDLAATLPVCWIDGAADPSQPFVRVDGALAPRDPLTALLLAVPDVGTDARAAWRNRVRAFVERR